MKGEWLLSSRVSHACLIAELPGRDGSFIYFLFLMWVFFLKSLLTSLQFYLCFTFWVFGFEA